MLTRAFRAGDRFVSFHAGVEIHIVVMEGSMELGVIQNVCEPIGHL